MTAFEYPHPKDKLVLLKRIPVFAACTDKQLLLIADRTRLVEYKKGEHVYRERDVADAFYIVVSGRLRVFSSVAGEEKTLTVLHNSDSFGEISLLTGETHSATVQALNDTLVLQLRKAAFEEVINRIPSLVLHLSRLLSKRLRMKESFGEYAEATIAAIYSASDDVGRTLLAVTLAAVLTRDTGRDTILVNLHPRGHERERYYGTARRTRKKLPGIPGLWSESELNDCLMEHPLGFPVLSAGPLLAKRVGSEAIAPLLSMLTKRYGYILIDVPAEVDAQVLKSLTQSDLIYLVTDQHRDNLIRTRAFVHQLQETLQPADQRMKVVVHRMAGIGLPVSLEEIGDTLGYPIASTLPSASPSPGSLTLEELGALVERQESPYILAVRRIGRELSGSLVGLALGSGAALGLAHIGILRVIERERIPIDVIAGSSIGALLGGLWASGVNADELERMALRFKNAWDIRRLFILDVRIPMVTVLGGVVIGLLLGMAMASWVGFAIGFLASLPISMVLGALSGGPIQGAQLMAKLERDFRGKSFEETWLPLKVIAANPMTREQIVFDSGSIAEAVRASVSIPGIFKPVTRRGRICLDGGVVNPVPVNVLKEAGAHRVIASNVFPTTEELTVHRQEVARRRADWEAQMASRSFLIRFFAWLRQEIVRSVSPLIFDVIMRSMQSMEHQIAEVSCHEADLTLRPTVPDSHWLEFFNPEKFIRRGEETALEHLTELKRLTGASDRGVDNL